MGSTRIVVVGGLGDGADKADVEAFGYAIGYEICSQGNVLLGANRAEFDTSVAKGADQACNDNKLDITTHFRSWTLQGRAGDADFGVKVRNLPGLRRRYHSIGDLQISELTSWDPVEVDWLDLLPEPIEQADVVVLVKGGKGTRRAAWWARHANKPILAMKNFGGSAARIHSEQMKDPAKCYPPGITSDDLAVLSRITTDWDATASEIVNLAERIKSSGIIGVAMAYPGDQDERATFESLFRCFEDAAKKHDFEARRVTAQNNLGNLVLAIDSLIRTADFMVVDITNHRANVFYELGQAQGMGKQVILTARRDTEMPFDISNLGVLFWEAANLKAFEDELAMKIGLIAPDFGRSIGSRDRSVA